MPVLAGTSGWQYRDWRDVLYPAGVPQRAWLEHYAGRYPAVENNGAFYRLPSRQTFTAWRDATPPGFLMAVKASRYLTHVRRLRDPDGPVRRLLDAAAGLGDRLGPVLLQLPPSLRADPAALDECLASFGRFAVTAPGQKVSAGASGGRPVRVAVEFRHESWWTEQTQEVLTRHRAALCWADRRGRPLAPLWRTAGWGYLRLHEGAASPWPSYGRQALTSWAARLADAWPADAEAFAFFNNDQHGAAVRDASAFRAIAGADNWRQDHAAGPVPDSG
jgi:uncharacterized protein YecE (DUF72 family)